MISKAKLTSNVTDKKKVIEEPVYQMLYASRVRYLHLFDLHFFEKLSSQSLKNNVKNNISGILCFGNGYFMQYLEGSEQELTNLKNTLLQDERHYELKLFDFSRVHERRLASSNNFMLVYLQDSSNELFTDFLPFKPSSWTLHKQTSLITSIIDNDSTIINWKISRLQMVGLRMRLIFQLVRHSLTKQQLIDFILMIVAFVIVLILILFVLL